jgi:hypothetical protein
MPDSQGRHNRAEMEAILRSGQGIVYKGQVITKMADLPTDADLAKGDPDKEAEVISSLQAEIDRLQVEKSRLTASESRAKPAESVPSDGTDQTNQGTKELKAESRDVSETDPHPQTQTRKATK